MVHYLVSKLLEEGEGEVVCGRVEEEGKENLWVVAGIVVKRGRRRGLANRAQAAAAAAVASERP